MVGESVVRCWAVKKSVLAVTQAFPSWLNWNHKSRPPRGTFPTAAAPDLVMAPPAALLALSFCLSVSDGSILVPLRLFSGNFNFSSAVGLVALRQVALTADGSGLSLASDPTGTVNFLDMVNNLKGDSGRGYYIELSIGSPGQKVICFETNLLLFV